MAANIERSTESLETTAAWMVTLSLAKEADVDFATMRASVNCVGDASCGGEDLIDALKVVEDTQYGQVIFGTIDVANQQDWGKADGNWSKDDIAAASEMSTTIGVLAQTGLDAASAAALASVTSSVADRLAQTGDAWEQLDTDRKWHDRGLVGAIKEHRSLIMTVVAAGICVSSVGTGCVVATGLAWAVRSEQRDGVGLSKADAADGLLTFGTLGLVKAPSALAASPARQAVPAGFQLDPVASTTLSRAIAGGAPNWLVAGSQLGGCATRSDEDFCRP